MNKYDKVPFLTKLSIMVEAFALASAQVCLHYQLWFADYKYEGLELIALLAVIVVGTPAGGYLFNKALDKALQRHST